MLKVVWYTCFLSFVAYFAYMAFLGERLWPVYLLVVVVSLISVSASKIFDRAEKQFVIKINIPKVKFPEVDSDHQYIVNVSTGSMYPMNKTDMDNDEDFLKLSKQLKSFVEG